MNTDKFPFKRTFKHNGGDFSATNQAEEYLRTYGFSIGSMCMNEPRGIKKGPGVWIHKWRNLSIDDKDMLDGVMTSDNPRSGDVTIHLYLNPE